MENGLEEGNRRDPSGAKVTHMTAQSVVSRDGNNRQILISKIWVENQVDLLMAVVNLHLTAMGSYG